MTNERGSARYAAAPRSHVFLAMPIRAKWRAVRLLGAVFFSEPEEREREEDALFVLGQL